MAGENDEEIEPIELANPELDKPYVTAGDEEDTPVHNNDRTYHLIKIGERQGERGVEVGVYILSSSNGNLAGRRVVVNEKDYTAMINPLRTTADLIDSLQRDPDVEYPINTKRIPKEQLVNIRQYAPGRLEMLYVDKQDDKKGEVEIDPEAD